MAFPFVGEIKMFGGSYAPNGYALCNGQLLPVAQNKALYSVLGTQFGGDGVNTVGLPNFNGRSPVGTGTLEGNPVAFTQASTGGAETATLTTANMPGHNHTLYISTGEGDSDSPMGNFLATANDGSGNQLLIYGSQSSGSMVPMSPMSISTTGGSQPFNVRNPYLVVTFIVAVIGVEPQKS
ncbi:tail fiber protein [Pseudomonas sp. 148P]|uniref:Tail fiber protein n=1 Tax=Pseudomonas ulcerans TaxID=3115852 RepID=A0ABU7HTI1_9PSED|nr:MULTISPECIES: tail fiber protein [unclassified Pseudomonas]MEE1923274.1 tail fiber protein [Pseudomonas sp. 147P]MEE1934851.1 tail fiber protein [Pseudomonas sp. 148P]